MVDTVRAGCGKGNTMKIENTVSGLTSEKARALILQGPAATQAIWARVQGVRCRENAPHHRYLVEARRGGKDTVVMDIGPCPHFPE